MMGLFGVSWELEWSSGIAWLELSVFLDMVGGSTGRLG